MNDEKTIEKRLVKEVKKIGGLALKFVSPGYDGIPDRLILIAYAKIGFVEVKTKGKKPRTLQVKRIKELESLGFKVFVLDDVNQIDGIINAIKGE